ncbi:MAG: class C sortase [Oscillospiraceae bacterium]|nr:class C sortase [Oscillospiraceae bacterium]
MKRRYFRIVIAGIIFILALLLTLYPIISNLYNRCHQSLIHTAYEEVIQQADTRDLERIREMAVVYNEAITPGTAADTYSKAAIEKASADYASQLDPSGSGIMGYVEIPKISVNLPIYHGTESETLERGTGHLLGSSLPVGGNGTHAIITGHSGLATQKMFTDLEQLMEGDVFYIHVLGEVLAYQVFSAEPVLPHNTSKLTIRQNEDLCTLITCYPTGINTHRLLVQGKRIPYEEAEVIVEEIVTQEAKPESNWEDQYMLGLWLGIWAMLLALAIYLSVLLIQRTRAKKRGGRYARKKETKRQ